ncbi:MAG TPA: DNA polymerase, partial [Chthonomonadales bacterium]|nr:DNA polymerase [Chthonomonadales bacterium]
LQKYHSVEGLLEHVPEVTPPRAMIALETHAEQARLSKRLATIECNVPLDLSIRPYRPGPEDWQRVRELFTELEFRSLLPRIPQPPGAPLAVKEGARPDSGFETETQEITGGLEQALEEVRRQGKIAIALDTDGRAPLHAALRGIGFAATPQRSWYLPLDAPALGGSNESLFHTPEPVNAAAGTIPPELRVILEDRAIAKSVYNAKAADIVLHRHGADPCRFQFDALLAAYLLNSGRSSYPLLDLAESHLGVRIEAEDAFTPRQSIGREAAVIAALVEPMTVAVAGAGMANILQEIELPLSPVLAEMERTGLLVDVEYLSRLSERIGKAAASLASEVYELAGETFNIGSTKQLQSILFGKLQIPTGRKTQTGFSTGADLLAQLAPQYEICRKILDYREVAKLKSTYADTLPKLVNAQTGRIHTTLNQTVASTGRLSSSDPNLQNIPIRSEVGREIRRAFIAPAGMALISCDYSQIELRLLAHIAGDKALIEAFAQDEDIHAATASTVFGVPLESVTPDQRRRAKTINFAVLYGQSGFALA